MKLNKILTAATIAAAFSASLTTGCYEGEMYDVGQPDWLTDSVSAVAARAAANAGESGFAAETVTADAWWTAWSKTYNFLENQRMTIEITLDKSTREKRWKNFAMVVATSGWEFPASGQPNGVDGYAEYFVVRGDGGNWNQTGKVTVTADESLDLANKDFVSFQEDGSKFTIVAEHYPTGSILIKSTQVTPSGAEYHWTANGTAKAGSGCQVFFAGEGSTFTITNITYETMEELKPKKLEVTGTPTAVSFTEEVVEPSYYYGDGVATVTWSNGTTSTVGIDELTFSVVPDLKTLGTALVTVAYAKTSMGQYCEPVSTGYKLEVAGKIESIKINPTSETPVYYYVPGTTEIKKEDIDAVSYIKSVVGVSGTTELPLGEDSYTTEVTIPATFGDVIVITVKYKDFSTPLNVAVKQLESEEISLASKCGKIGNEDNSNAWWVAHTPEDYKLETGKGIKIKFKNYGCTNNWNNWILILRSAAGVNGNTPAGAKEYIVARADNWCWGTGFTDDEVHGPADAVKPSSNWGITKESNAAGDDDWATWLAAMKSGVEISMEIINKGSSADVKCTFTYNKTEYYQRYLNIPKDAGDMFIDFAPELCHLVFE